MKKKALSLSRKKTMSMAALRRYIWKLIAKKEIPKVSWCREIVYVRCHKKIHFYQAHRQHVQNQTNKFALLKKVG